MDNNQLFRKKHELWLTLKYSSLPIKDGAISNALRNFSEVSFRHMKWLGEAIVTEIQDYDYTDHESDLPEPPKMFDFEKGEIDIQIDSGRKLLENCREKMGEMVGYYDETKQLHRRMAGDDRYFLFRLDRMLGVHKEIEVGDTFFGGEAPIQEMIGMDEAGIASLVEILKSQQTKEYHDVVAHLYALAHMAKTDIAEIFYELLTESFYHQFHYARLLASLGVVEIPATVEKSEYQIGDMRGLILRLIKSENSEVENLKIIAEKATSEDFKKMCDFVLNQESHHISLLEEALEVLDGKSE